MTDAFICDGARTPIGRFGGALASLRADDLATVPIKALLARNPGLDPATIDEVMLGCVNQAGEDNRNVARMAALLAGLPPEVPGVTFNRLCASGADAVGSAARAINAAQIDLAIAGGVESMTRSPFVMGKADKPWSRAASIEDTTIGWRFINPAMRAQYGVDSMPETAENVADQFGIGRDAQDRFALASQQRTAAAQQRGFFEKEIVPVKIENRKTGMIEFSRDEHPRADTDAEGLAALRPIVRPDGTVTAGNASGVNDGAAALIVASRVAAAQHGLIPRARIIGMASAGVEPRIMGIGPVPACQKLMERLGMTIDDFDHIEINEAFAAQVIACMQQLGADPFGPKVNPNGGAIAMGHPLGASGARLLITATNALEEQDGRFALVTMCIGVGQGLAIAIERVDG